MLFPDPTALPDIKNIYNVKYYIDDKDDYAV